MNPWVLTDIIGFIFLGTFFIVGLINLFYPRVIWKIRYGWKAVKEPPKSYFLIQRFIGAVTLSIPIIYLVVIHYLSSQN